MLYPTVADIAGAVTAAGLAAPSAVWVTRRFAGLVERREIFILTMCIGIVVATSVVVMPTWWLFCATVGLGWALVVLAAVDFATFRLPDVLTMPLAVAGVAVAWTLPGQPVLSHVAAGSIAYIALAALAWAFRAMRGKDGLGLGDAKLAAAAGAWLGAPDLPYTIVLACAAAFLWVGLRTLMHGAGALTEKIPFGPPLALAIWIAWLYGSFSPPPG